MTMTKPGCVCSSDERAVGCPEILCRMIFCTRLPGHDGNHVACTSSEHRIVEWKPMRTFQEIMHASQGSRDAK